MKKSILPLWATAVALTLTSLSVHAQAIFSRFDFNGTPLTTATIGPNGISVDPDAVIDGTAAYINSNCSGTKGIDLLIPNLGGLFDRSSMGMAFGFRKEESRSDFFIRGGTAFYQEDGVLFVQYRTTDGAGGTIDYGPVNTGFILPYDAAYHDYMFVYEEITGVATVTVDGATIYTFDGPDNRPYDWTGAPNPIVGTVMDGNCPGGGVLDYAYFFDPETPLPSEFIRMAVEPKDGDVQLDWEVISTAPLQSFQVERSRDGQAFETIATLPAASEQVLAQYRDIHPGGGEWYYRIVSTDVFGESSRSETQRIQLDATIALQAWPNPSNGNLQLLIPTSLAGQSLQLLNLQGQELQTRTATEGRMAWSLEDLPPGYYLLQGQSGGQRFQQQVLLY